MFFEATFAKEGKWWVIESPLLAVGSQGTSKANALAMLADAIEALVNKADFKVTVTECASGTGTAVVSANDSGALVALALRRQRANSGQSIASVTAKLRQKSRNAYARYEQGKAMPSADRFAELFSAAAPGVQCVLRAVPITK